LPKGFQHYRDVLGFDVTFQYGEPLYYVRLGLPARPSGYARKNQFLEPDQRDLGCPVPLEKIFCFSEAKNNPISAPVPPHRGALAIVIDAGRDAMDADGASDEGA
jgi:hypothetical protein